MTSKSHDETLGFTDSMRKNAKILIANVYIGTHYQCSRR